ncbi:MAG: hypothetical protein ACP5QU_07955 [Anaerolineae bacterium]
MNKNTGLIATIVTALLCGCPGLFGLCFGLISVAAGMIPGAQIDFFGSNDPGSAMTMGFVSLCLAVVFIAIPVAVGVLTLRKKPQAAEASSEEPIPPAS